MNWLMTVHCEDQKHAHQPVAFLGERRLHAITVTFLSLQPASNDYVLQSHDAFDAGRDAIHMTMIDIVDCATCSKANVNHRHDFPGCLSCSLLASKSVNTCMLNPGLLIVCNYICHSPCVPFLTGMQIFSLLQIQR